MLRDEQALVHKLQKSMMNIVIKESVDQRLQKLAKSGLMDDDESKMFIKIMRDLENEKELSPQQKIMVVRLFDKLLNLIMSNSAIYQKILKRAKEDSSMREQRERNTFESLHTIVERNGEKYYVDEGNNLKPYTSKVVKDFIYANKMYDQKI